MKYTIVGSGTAVPSVRRGSPCSHVTAAGGRIVLDLGSGSVRELWKLGLDIRKVDVLALSHFHPDHTADLVPLLFALRNPEFGSLKDLLIVGPRGTGDYLKALEGLYGRWVRPENFTLEVREVYRDTVEFGDWRLVTAPTGHTPESVAFRVEEGEGAVAVYGGDSPYSEDLVRLARGAGLLVLECSLPEGSPAEGHLTPSEAAAIAAASGARRLVLTHLYPSAERSDLLTPAGKHFDGEVVLAHDGLELSL